MNCMTVMTPVTISWAVVNSFRKKEFPWPVLERQPLIPVKNFSYSRSIRLRSQQVPSQEDVRTSFELFRETGPNLN